MALTFSDLQQSVGKSMADLCPNKFFTPAQSHCAHYVSHMLDLKLGILCGDMTYAKRRTGASIRVDEIYNRLHLKGPWEEKPDFSTGLLIFVIAAENMINGTMTRVSQKHVGIHYGNKVFNFSNTQHRVVADQTVDSFHSKFKAAYAPGNICLYYGVAP